MTEFNVPVVEYDNYLIIPLLEGLSDEKLHYLETWLLEKLSWDDDIQGVVLDLSSVRVIDSYTARVFGELSSSLFMEGSGCVMAGMRPEVAITLVEMGVDLSDIKTALDVAHAVELLQPDSKNAGANDIRD